MLYTIFTKKNLGKLIGELLNAELKVAVDACGKWNNPVFCFLRTSLIRI